MEQLNTSGSQYVNCQRAFPGLSPIYSAAGADRLILKWVHRGRENLRIAARFMAGAGPNAASVSTVASHGSP
jgi:ribose 1,5-bisphosphokinase PhnN